MRNNADEIATSLQKFATKGVSEIQSSINRNMAKVNNLIDVALQTDLKNIAKSNFNTYRAYELELIKTRLQEIVDETSNAEAKSLAKMGLEGVDNQLASLKTKASTIKTKADAALAVIDTDALIPTSRRSDITPDTPPSTIESTIQKIRNNPKKYPFFPEFESTVKSFGFKKNIEDLMLANYQKYFDYTPDELIKNGIELTKNMNEKNWGWLKKFFIDVSSGKVRVKNLSTVIALVVFAAVAIPWGITGIEASEKLRGKTKEVLGLDDNSSEDSSGEYEGKLDGFKKFVEAEVQAVGYTPDEIDGDYVLKPNGYDENPEYYKDYLQKFKYEDGTFKQK